MSRIIKDIFILFAITLVAGLALGAVFNLTKGARNEQEKKKEYVLMFKWSHPKYIL